MRQSANKQVDVDLVGKLKFMNKFIVKIIEAGKEVAQSAKNTPKSQENKGIFWRTPVYRWRTLRHLCLAEKWETHFSSKHDC